MHPFASFTWYSADSRCFLSRFSLFFLLCLGLLSQAFAAPFTYVRLGDKVAILDMATNSVVREIAVSASGSIALAPSGRHLYLTSNNSRVVSVVDIAAGTINSFRPMATDGLPVGVATHPNGTRLYVTNFLGESLSVIDLATNLPIAQIPLISPRAIAVSPTGSFAYVAQTQPNVSPTTPRTVAVVDLQQNRVVAEIPISVSSETILFSPNGSRAYFVNFFRDIYVVDTANHKVIDQWVLAGDFAFGVVDQIALSADGSRLYAVAGNNRRLLTVDTSTGSIVANFEFQSAPSTSLAVDSAQQVAILFGDQTGLSTSVNLSTGSIIKSLRIGGTARGSSQVVVNALPTQQVIDGGGSSGGGGGCGYTSGPGGPPDPILPTLVALAMLVLALRRRAHQR